MECFPGAPLMLDGGNPVICVSCDGETVRIRVGTAHPEPVEYPVRRLRKATEDEVDQFEYYFRKQLAAAVDKGEL
jgi:hypothetical protein